MNQALRERTLERLKDGRLDILIATDVAARGLDVERISLVVNYDIPMDSRILRSPYRAVLVVPVVLAARAAVRWRTASVVCCATSNAL